MCTAVSTASDWQITADAPLQALASQAQAVGADLMGGLPHFWTLALNLRFRP